MAKFIDLKNAVIKKETYSNNGRIALLAVDAKSGEHLTTLTVNIPEFDLIPCKQILVKDWGENEGVLEDLIEMKIVEPEHARIPTGFVSAALCTLNEEEKWQV